MLAVPQFQAEAYTYTSNNALVEEHSQKLYNCMLIIKDGLVHFYAPFPFQTNI